jgi:hypothetical protein
VLAAVALLQFPLIWQRAINWDEMFHYAQITRFRNGTLTAPLQTFYIRLFDWIYDLPGNSIDHIVAARFVMFGFELLAAIAIAGIAMRFFDRATALLCAAAYLSAGFVFQHGFSFRADPVAAGLLMGGLWLIAATRLQAWVVVLGGVLLGVATIYTIKVVLYAPAFAGIAWWAWNNAGRSRDFALRLIAMAVCAVVTCAGLYFWHSATLHGEVARAAGAGINSSVENMFFIGVPRYLVFMLKQVALAPVFVALLVLAPGRIFAPGRPAAERIALAGMIAPIATLAFYHNTAPYYYVFILAPIAVGIGASIAWAKGKLGVIALAAAILVNAAMLWIREDPAPMQRQHELVDVVTRSFPERVAYFDFCGFVGRFPKANGFMTPWGLVGYLRGEGPGYRQRMEMRVVPLVIDDDPMFQRLFAGVYAPEFRPEDARALRSNYVKFWGPLWIAGKSVSHTVPTAEEFLVPGTYTVRDGAVLLDGQRLEAGSTVMIERGIHQLAAATDRPARLTWGNRIDPPAQPASDEPFWVPF